jgi:Ankyrin repeats (3 copies)/Ankyrin repeat
MIAGIREEFIKAATWYGDLQRAREILEGNPGLAGSDLHVAAVLGDDAAVRRFLADDPQCVNAKSGPYGGDALNYLGLSKYLRLEPDRTAGFLHAAAALLDAGADPNTGFWTTGQHPERETVLYGAAGVAHHPELTRLLLERGADPRDVEVVYHSPEGHDSRAMQLVVETGKLSRDDLRLMLIRKLDWHDEAGVRWLLARGADVNLKRAPGGSPLHHALARDNSLAIIGLLLDHGADPLRVDDGLTAIAMAARRGRSDVLEELERRGHSQELQAVDRLLAACARNETRRIRTIAETEPGLVRELLADGANHLCRFTLTWNTAGTRQLLDLGVPVDAPWEGDGYFGIPNQSTALHVAAWMLLPPLIGLLLERGAEVNRRDGRGNTGVALAVKACVDSYWTERRSPEPVAALLAAGATLDGVPFPSGYDEVDELLRAHGKSQSGA